MVVQRGYWMFVLVCAAALSRVPPLPAQTPGGSQPAVNMPMFHGGRERWGWNALEMELTSANVSSSSFGPLWNSPALDAVVIGGKTYAPHLYASPLYIDDVPVSAGTHAGPSFRVIFAATSNGYVYAINAFSTGGTNPVPAGTILWKRKLGEPGVMQYLDGGVPLGILSTPVIDLDRTPPRLYVTGADATAGWQVFALDITNGEVLPGWPL